MKGLIWKNVIQTLAAIAFLLAVWFVAYFAVGNELLIPPISDSLKEVGALLVSGGFWKGLLFTLLRALFAFAISFVLAVIFAVVAYLYPSFGSFLSPLVSVLRSMPILAVLLILLSFLNFPIKKLIRKSRSNDRLLSCSITCGAYRPGYRP